MHYYAALAGGKNQTINLIARSISANWQMQMNIVQSYIVTIKNLI